MQPARIAGNLTTTYCIYGFLVAIPLSLLISFGFILGFMKLPSLWVGMAAALISAWWVGVLCSKAYAKSKDPRISSVIGVASAFFVILIGLFAAAAMLSLRRDALGGPPYLLHLWYNFKPLVSLVLPWATIPALLLGGSCGRQVHKQLFPAD
jgi:hypothetical protein